MAWLEITLQTPSGQTDRVCTLLTAKGFSDLVIEDQQEFENFLEDNRAYWDYIDESLQEKLQGLSQIKLYLEDTDTASLAQLKELASQQALDMKVETMAEVDWSESWKENYPPQEVGASLVVLPYWLADTDTQGRKAVILDPGLTFGTGAHPSTRMVMQTMEQLVKPGFSCLDLGSGSGILSIAALRLGAKQAIGVDIDPKAEDIARENAGYNGFAAPEFTALTGNVTEDKALMERLSRQHYDLLLVNIVADVIIALAPVLPAFMDSSTTVICSGILDTRLEDVKAALTAAGLTVLTETAMEDWRCLSAKKE